jgi:hypothetical protein
MGAVEEYLAQVRGSQLVQVLVHVLVHPSSSSNGRHP